MSLARNVATVGTATLVSRVLGFARDVMIAAVFGTGIRADAFFVAFQLANLTRRMLAEGALNAALVPLYLRERDTKGEQAAGTYAGRLIGTLALGAAVSAGIAALAMPLIVFVFAPGFHIGGARMPIAVELMRLMLPYLVVAGPLAVLMGVLNANHRFAAAAFAAAAFNATMLAGLAFITLSGAGDSAFSGRVLAITVGVAGLMQLALVTSAVWIGSERATPLSVSFGQDVRRFFALAIPGLVAGGIPQLTVIAGVMVASASRGAVSWIYYANRLIELPLGIVGIAVGTVLVPAFTRAVRNGDVGALSAAESRGLELTSGLSLPAAIALFVLSEPIVRVLFERGAFTTTDTQATAAALAAFALGLPGHVLVKSFSPAFFAREDTATPMRAALIGFAVAILGSLALLPVAGHVGIAVAIALSGWVSAGYLGLRIARRIGFLLDREARQRLPRIALATVAMGTAVAVARAAAAPWLSGEAAITSRIAGLTALVVFGIVLYGVLLQLLGVMRLKELASFARKPL